MLPEELFNKVCQRTRNHVAGSWQILMCVGSRASSTCVPPCSKRTGVFRVTSEQDEPEVKDGLSWCEVAESWPDVH